MLIRLRQMYESGGGIASNKAEQTCEACQSTFVDPITALVEKMSVSLRDLVARSHPLSAIDRQETPD